MSVHPSTKRSLWAVTALVGLLIGLFGTTPAQASDADTHSVTWKVQVGEQSSDFAIQGMRFLPGEIWIDQGDSISFLAKSAEPHTVSFGTPPLPPTNFNNVLADAVPPVGGRVFNPSAPWTNSGILTTMPSSAFPSVTSYVQKFTLKGSFTFYCLLHGKMMSLTVHVQPAHSKYPHSQAYYNEQAEVQTERIIDDGMALWEKTADMATPTHVYVGASDTQAMVMRFIWPKNTVPAGTTVTFDMSANKVFVPHTVTFTSLQQNGKPVDSGNMFPAFAGGPSMFKVTFDQTGTWKYICEFHDTMGMVGSVKVTPKS
ncbi:plastocyanin/azurin family copper-binding protein [Arthrobacter sp. efr-133-TYG-104]|uniref:cupredoxin domain-containing protein n=1 Tax=Arthrobacter sp. efr-133-TYG-104 TaxID=3040324 RepID=UPI00254FE78F|nr:plastocyanin/azurin family copper-binding protein [Arthrobacter sp. efr-133-TYG-104]